MRLYVGNLQPEITEEGLRELFSAHGRVSSVAIIRDRGTRHSKGFAFVEMANDAEAKDAISAMNNKEIDGRQLKVNEAKPRNEKPRY